MSSSSTQRISLPFGETARVDLDVDSDQLALFVEPPAAVTDVMTEIRSALENPVDFPPLTQAVIPDDRVALAVCATTPQKEAIIAAVWEQLDQREIQPENVTIVCQSRTDPRTLLPGRVATTVNWVVHDPDDANRCGYLASSSGGERIYLARELLDADVVVPIGPIGFDPLLGFCGTNSALYPDLSNREAIDGARGQGHSELDPENVRPLRQLIDEISWLLGSQFTIQTVGNSRNQFSHLLAGATEAVFREGKRLLSSGWTVEVEERVDMVIAAVDSAAGPRDWNDLGMAIAAASRIVAREGRIVILSDAASAGDTGVEMLRRCEEASDVLKPLRLEIPTDVIPVTQLVTALNKARIYLLSQHDEDFVEDLFMTPLSEAVEVTRLLKSETGSVAVIGSAQNVFSRLSD